MVDFFIDKILSNEELENKWFQVTKSVIKNHSLKYVLDRIYQAHYELSDQYWLNPRYPSKLFEGNIKISEIANSFEIKPLGKKVRICPFHEDTNESLSLSDEKQLFHCFGCGKSGNIITFYAELKKIFPDNEFIKQRRISSS